MATRQLASPASAQSRIRHDLPVPVSRKLRLTVPFDPFAFLRSSAPLRGIFYRFCAGFNLPVVAWRLWIRVVRSSTLSAGWQLGTGILFAQQRSCDGFFDCFRRK
jgi:hypothetical protein